LIQMELNFHKINFILFFPHLIVITNY
jgi:hypothetical protein